MKCFSVPAMDQLWQLREKAQKKVMEVGGDVSNGLLSVETKSRQTGGETERKWSTPPTHTHVHLYTHTHIYTHRQAILRQLTL